MKLHCNIYIALYCQLLANCSAFHPIHGIPTSLYVYLTLGGSSHLNRLGIIETSKTHFNRGNFFHQREKVTVFKCSNFHLSSLCYKVNINFSCQPKLAAVAVSTHQKPLPARNTLSCRQLATLQLGNSAA